jgi:hypothetical protein
MMSKATKAKKAPTKPQQYVLPIKFNPEERARLEAVEKKRGLRRSSLLKMLLKDEANRLDIP